MEENSLPNTQQSEETKRLVSNAVRVLDKLSQPDPAVVATIQQLPVRVYLQIFDEKQREKAQEIQTKLRQEGFLVPGIENVSEKVPKSVKRTDVRFFNDSDADVANHVKDILIRNGFPTVDVLHPKIKANPRTLEIWFATAD